MILLLHKAINFPLVQLNSFVKEEDIKLLGPADARACVGKAMELSVMGTDACIGTAQ
jgi:hypothetical protein